MTEVHELEKLIGEKDDYIRKLERQLEMRKKAAGTVFCTAIEAGLIEGAAEAQTELDRLDALKGKLEMICASAYQLAGIVGAPVRFLDVLANPCDATQDQIDALLPVREDEIDATRENTALKALIDAVMAIPKMTDEDLAQLKENCLAVINSNGSG